MNFKLLTQPDIMPALYGLGLSFGVTSNITYSQFCCDAELKTRMLNRARKNAPINGGHNKFLESIQVHIELIAPRFFWQEFDTYRVGVSKQSDSTMHTLLKDPQAIDKLWDSVKESLMYVPLELAEMVEDIIVRFEKVLKYMEESGSEISEESKLQVAKNLLPEAWPQTRVISVNYKTLQNIYQQRKNHKLWQWKWFCGNLSTLPYSEFIMEK